MNSNQEKTVAAFVLDDYRNADVFKRYKIDFCCGGKKSLESVCADKGLDLAEILQELELATLQPSGVTPDFQVWSLNFLTEYIENMHHSYVRKSIPLIQEYTLKVARVHGDLHPENREILARFYDLGDELLSHMEKEEKVLFPAVRNLETQGNSGIPFKLEAPVKMMMTEHDNAGDIIKEIRKLSHDYTPPEDACNTYRVAYAKLQEFENDLFKHIHLENNILFPQILKLESELQEEFI